MICLEQSQYPSRCSTTRPAAAVGALYKTAGTLFAAALLLGTIGCSGGGGGGSGGGGGGGRTTDTAIRIVHGALDQPPVDLAVDSVFVESARFGEATQYVSVDQGPRSLVLTATNAPGTVVQNLTGNFESETEYSMILFGRVDNGTFRAALVPDQIVRPAEGFAAVRVVHSVVGQGPITVTAGGVALPETGYGNVNTFTTIPSGVVKFDVKDRSGGTLTSLTATVEDRGEVTLLVSGDQNIGALFVTPFTDLD